MLPDSMLVNRKKKLLQSWEITVTCICLRFWTLTTDSAKGVRNGLFTIMAHDVC